MSDFALLEKALATYESTKPPRLNAPFGRDEIPCPHPDPVHESGVVICMDCGEEIERPITHEKEWRYYGPGDGKRSSDPNRVQLRKKRREKYQQRCREYGLQRDDCYKSGRTVHTGHQRPNISGVILGKPSYSHVFSTRIRCLGNTRLQRTLFEFSN